MKKIFVLFASIILTIIFSHTTQAALVNVSVTINFFNSSAPSTGSGTNANMGHVINITYQPNMTAVYIVNATHFTTCTTPPNKVYLHNIANGLLTSGTTVDGRTISFTAPYLLANITRYQLTMDRQGSVWTHCYPNLASNSYYPQQVNGFFQFWRNINGLGGFADTQGFVINNTGLIITYQTSDPVYNTTYSINVTNVSKKQTINFQVKMNSTTTTPQNCTVFNNITNSYSPYTTMTTNNGNCSVNYTIQYSNTDYLFTVLTYFTDATSQNNTFKVTAIQPYGYVAVGMPDYWYWKQAYYEVA